MKKYSKKQKEEIRKQSDTYHQTLMGILPKFTKEETAKMKSNAIPSFK